MWVGSAPTPAAYWKPLLSGCGKQKRREEGKGKEHFSPAARTALASLGSSACPLLRVPAPAHIPVVTFPGRACTQVTSAPSDRASPAPAVRSLCPSAAASTCPRGCSVGPAPHTHGSRDAFWLGCSHRGIFFLPAKTQDVFLPAPARCFFTDPRTGALIPS